MKIELINFCLIISLKMWLQNSKSSNTRPPHRPKLGQNWGSGGHGMQAIFLDSAQKSCGTGVFLPQRAGTNTHPNNKKPGTYYNIIYYTLSLIFTV